MLPSTVTGVGEGSFGACESPEHPWRSHWSARCGREWPDEGTVWMPLLALGVQRSAVAARWRCPHGFHLADSSVPGEDLALCSGAVAQVRPCPVHEAVV